MQGRTILAAAFVAAFTMAASTAGAAVYTPGGRAANTLTVWLQVDAQTGWPDASRPRTVSSNRRTPAGT